MNIPEQGDKIFYTVNWLTSESVLEQMSVAFVFLIKVMSICHSDYLYDIADVLYTESEGQDEDDDDGRDYGGISGGG